MKKQFYLFSVASLILLPICRGESVTKPSKSQPPKKKNTAAPKQDEKIPDYSKGFAVFHKMGLPNVAKSEFGQLDVWINLIGDNDYNIFGYRRHNGNAWLLDGDPKTKARYLYKQSVIISVKSRKQAQDDAKEKAKKEAEARKKAGKKDKKKNRREELLAQMGYARNQLISDFRKTDIKQDYKNILTNLQKALSRQRNDFDNINSGRILLYAVQLHDKGLKKEANQLAHLVFEKCGGRKKVLTSAVSSLANGQYLSIYYQFRADKDWKKYSSDLDALLARMPAVWNMRPAMNKLAGLLKAKSAGKITPVSGDKLTPDDKKLAKELINATKMPTRRFYFRGANMPEPETNYPLWILPVKTKSKPANDPVAAIIAKGVNAIPLLIALYKNTDLTAILPDGNSYSYSFNSSNNEESDTAKTDRLFNEMNQRPMTRGEVARTLATKIIPGKDNSYERDLEQEIERLNDLYSELKGKNASEIAVYYLENGTREQKEIAITSLSKSKDKKNIALIEKFFLENPKHNTYENGELIKFVENRGPDAAKFADKYIGRLKKMTDQFVRERSQYLENKKQLETIKKRIADNIASLSKKLHDITSSITPAEILNEYIAGKRKWEDVGRLFEVKTKKLGFDEKSKVVLEAVIKAKNAKEKSNILNIINISEYHRYYLEYQDKSPEVKVSANKTLWEQVLNSKSTTKDGIKLKDQALRIIENISTLGTNVNNGLFNTYCSETRLMDFLEKRAGARLADKKVPDFPVGKLAEDKLKALREKLTKTTSGKLVDTLNSFSDNELIAVGKSLKPNGALNRKLLTKANKITKIENKLKDKKLAAAVPALSGSLDMKKIKKLFEYVKAQIIARSPVSCTILREQGLTGVKIVFELDHGANNQNQSLDAKQSIHAQAMINNNLTNSYWYIDNKNKKKSATKSDEDDLLSEAEDELIEEETEAINKQQKDFWNKVETILTRTNALQKSEISLGENTNIWSEI